MVATESVTLCILDRLVGLVQELIAPNIIHFLRKQLTIIIHTFNSQFCELFQFSSIYFRSLIFKMSLIFVLTLELLKYSRRKDSQRTHNIHSSMDSETNTEKKQTNWVTPQYLDLDASASLNKSIDIPVTG